VALGANVSAFRPEPEVIRARQARLRTGEPLRVLYVGNLSFQKGLIDLAAAATALAGQRFTFQLVGGVTPEARPHVKGLGAGIEVLGHVPERDLPKYYAAADVFLFPTIQDGFAVVLVQAQAAGLPILATTNCAAPDLIRGDRDGWIVPIRSPQAIIERLRLCDTNRESLAAMTQSIYERFDVRDWARVAEDFERECLAGTSGAGGVATHA
jgi:glycosyltransferase involved in cell wall biosynthesis